MDACAKMLRNLGKLDRLGKRDGTLFLPRYRVSDTLTGKEYVMTLGQIIGRLYYDWATYRDVRIRIEARV